MLRASRAIRRPSTSHYCSLFRKPIQLTPCEQQLFSFLLSVKKRYNLQTTLRVAGGWVRDKLLNKDSADIDITVDDMTGEAFGEFVGQASPDPVTLSTIKSNPEQSKHLSTTILRLFGTPVNFNGLRSDTYLPDSRIPVIETNATPLADALRRDFTVNCLFYKIENGEIEDLTGQGIPDLNRRMIRTPCEPLRTFTDDPLRVLRAIRFAVYLNPTVTRAHQNNSMIDPLTSQAMKLETVHHGLRFKVSRERVIAEFEKIFAMPNWPLGLDLLYEHGLFPSVFPMDPQPSAALIHQITSEVTPLLSNSDDIFSFWFSLLLFLSQPQLKPRQIVEWVTHTMKSTRQVARNTVTYLAALNQATEILPLCTEDESQLPKHVLPISYWIYQSRTALWPALLLASFCAKTQAPDLQKFHRFVEMIQKHPPITGAWALKPVLDGDEIMAIKQIGAGPAVNHLREKLLMWQLANPAIATNRDHARKFLLSVET